MALTARNPDTGEIILPDRGVLAVCRDTECGSRMASVSAVVAEGVTARCAHWRHVTTAERTCSRAADDRDRKSPWHEQWQLRCSDPWRVEHRHQVGDQVRIADVWTAFGWAVEVQHSGIAPATVRARENHYQGRVLWLVDAATDAAPAYVDQWTSPKGTPMWRIGVPLWVPHLLGAVAFDAEDRVVILPPDKSPKAWLRGAELVVPANLCRTLHPDTFAAEWINGDTLPLPGGLLTPWQKRQADKDATARATERAREAAVQARRAAEQRDRYQCDYQGDTSRLLPPVVMPDPVATEIDAPPVPPREYSPQATAVIARVAAAQERRDRAASSPVEVAPEPVVTQTPAVEVIALPTAVASFTHTGRSPVSECARGGCSGPASDPDGASPADGWAGLLCSQHRESSATLSAGGA